MSKTIRNSHATKRPRPAQGGEVDEIAEAEKVARSNNEALAPFFERRKPDKGLILRERLFNAIATAESKLIPICIHDYTCLKLSLLLAHEKLSEYIDELFVMLRGKVRGYKDGKPVVTSPPSSPDYRKAVLASALVRYLADYRPVTPPLEHNPDPRHFLLLLRALFPNVADAASCANAWRAFIEQVHHSCGTVGAQFFQIALWLFSPKPGLVGKSYILGRLYAALQRLGICVGKGCFTGDHQFLDPSIGMYTVTIADETQFLAREILPSLNLVIDQSDFGFNIKKGVCGMAHSYANLVFGSNDVSSLVHSRRFKVVPYLTTQLKGLSAEEREKYFPLWGDDKAVEDALVELFAVAPFTAEHADWGTRTTDADKERVVVPERFAGILDDIATTLEHPGDDIDVNDCRPSAFFKKMRDVCGYDGLEKRVAKEDLRDLLNLLRSLRQLDYNGAGDVFYAPISWTVFGNVAAGVAPVDPAPENADQPTADHSKPDPFAATAKQWKTLIEAEQ